MRDKDTGGSDDDGVMLFFSDLVGLYRVERIEGSDVVRVVGVVGRGDLRQRKLGWLERAAKGSLKLEES